MAESRTEALPDAFAVRRILAAFGPATMSAGALAGAVELAGRLGAELETLFVEDMALLQWTELPFVRPVSLHGQVSIPLSQGELEMQFRALAADAQARLTAFAARQQLRWSFRTARGQILAEVSAAAARTDLLVLASSSRPIARAALLEPSVRSLIELVGAPVLLLRPEQPPGGPVHVLLEEADSAERLLDAAIAMANGYAAGSTVTVWTTTEAPLESKLKEVLTSRAAIRLQRFSGSAVIETLFGAVGGGTLVLSAMSGLLRLPDWWQHLARARCALLLVRGSPNRLSFDPGQSMGKRFGPS